MGETMSHYKKDVGNQQATTNSVYWSFFNQVYMFRATNSSILRSTFWMYIQFLVQCTDIAAGWQKNIGAICVGKNTRNYIQYFLTVVLFTFCTCCILRCVVCIVVSCLVCIVVAVLCVLLSSYVYLLYCVCIAILTLYVGLLARSQYSEGPATGHLDTGFSWFPYVYKQMLR